MKKLLVTLVAVLAPMLLHADTEFFAAESGRTPRNEVVDRFLRSEGPPLVSYRARRTLTASALGGRVGASLVADTSLDEDGIFRFDIVREEGSAIVRERVLKAALLAERRSHAAHEIPDIALTPRNYEFQVGSESEAPGFVQFMLIAKRRSPMLLNGAAVVSADGADLIRVEGSPASPPSVWTRRVNIICEYARIDGVRVTVAIRSQADVRLVGDSVFGMTYKYRMINGRPTD
jgi:hypothetical protein